MKTKLVLSALLGCSLLALAPTASAQGGGQDVQTYKAQFTLVGTESAPAGAKGKGTVTSAFQDGAGTATLLLTTQGLEPGDYDVTGVRASDASTANLGVITVPDTGGKPKTSDVIEIPGDVEAADLSSLTVSQGGTAMLVGDLADPSGKSKASLNATVPIIPGEGAPEATGFAKLKSAVKKGTVKNNFLLLANGVAPNTTYLVTVDGVEATTVTSNSRGKVMVKKLPAEITSIGTVRLVDEGGVEALRAEF
jgi:hypothetical protein